MATYTWKLSATIRELDDRGFIFDMGQLKGVGKYLDRLAKKGLLIKNKAYWPWLTCGTCLKTIYAIPGRKLEVELDGLDRLAIAILKGGTP